MDEAISDDGVMKVGVMCRRFVAEWGATNADVAERVARMRRSDDFMIVGIMILILMFIKKMCIQCTLLSSESGDRILLQYLIIYGECTLLDTELQVRQ